MGEVHTLRAGRSKRPLRAVNYAMSGLAVSRLYNASMSQ